VIARARTRPSGFLETQELLLPPPALGFACMRIPLRDADGEDVGVFFERVRCWIEDALATGGSVLVHCHEGKSRSVALVAAHLMASHGLDLASALAKIRWVMLGRGLKGGGS
jgi:hypothetical protein